MRSAGRDKGGKRRPRHLQTPGRSRIPPPDITDKRVIPKEGKSEMNMMLDAGALAAEAG